MNKHIKTLISRMRGIDVALNDLDRRMAKTESMAISMRSEMNMEINELNDQDMDPTYQPKEATMQEILDSLEPNISAEVQKAMADIVLNTSSDTMPKPRPFTEDELTGNMPPPFTEQLAPLTMDYIVDAIWEQRPSIGKAEVTIQFNQYIGEILTTAEEFEIDNPEPVVDHVSTDYQHWEKLYYQSQETVHFTMKRASIAESKLKQLRKILQDNGDTS